MQSSFILLVLLMNTSVELKPHVTKELLTEISDQLNRDYIVEVDVDPKAFDYDPDALEKKEKNEAAADTTKIKFISRAGDEKRKEESEVALSDYHQGEASPFTHDMYLIPGENVKVQGTVLDYERAPVSEIQQDGVTIIANYPRENTLSPFDTPGYRSQLMGFYIDKHAVTNQQYAEFIRVTHRAAPHGWDQGRVPAGWSNQPVVNVSYDDAAAYAAWAGKRLPRDSEYERAMRKFPSLRLGAPIREWTSTVSNPNQIPERIYRYGGTPALPSQFDQQTGFRTALDNS